MPSYCFSCCFSLKTAVIPEGVTEIGSHAFEHCFELINVTLPNTVEKIGNNAFCECEKIKKITLPSSLTEFGAAVFDDCESLTAITVSPSKLHLLLRYHSDQKYKIFILALRNCLEAGTVSAEESDVLAEQIQKHLTICVKELLDFPPFASLITERKMINRTQAEEYRLSCQSVECKVIFLNYINSLNGNSTDSYKL